MFLCFHSWPGLLSHLTRFPFFLDSAFCVHCKSNMEYHTALNLTLLVGRRNLKQRFSVIKSNTEPKVLMDLFRKIGVSVCNERLGLVVNITQSASKERWGTFERHRLRYKQPSRTQGGWWSWSWMPWHACQNIWCKHSCRKLALVLRASFCCCCSQYQICWL